MPLPGMIGGGILGAAAAIGDVITISDLTVTDIVVSPNDASATYTLESDGDISRTITSGTTDLGDWIIPKTSAGGAYEARVTVTSGTLDAGTSGSWLALSSDRSWTKTRTSNIVGVNTCVFTLEIRRASDSVVLDTATITLEAEVS